MSNKTTFKRISLAVVAALGFGVLASGPSSAVIQVGSTMTATAVNTSVKTTETASATIAFSYTAIGNNIDTVSITAVQTAGPAAGPAATLAGFRAPVAADSASAATLARGGTGNRTFTATSAANTDKVVTFNARFDVDRPTTAGTYTYTFYASFPDGTTPVPTAPAPVTYTFTVVGLDNVIAKATSIIQEGTSAAASATADSAVVASGLVSGTQVANIWVTPVNAAGETRTVSGEFTESITAVITGPGLLAAGTSASAGGTAARSVAVIAGNQYIRVLADGTGGVGTITLYKGLTSTILATETVNFSGVASTATLTLGNTVTSKQATDSQTVVRLVIKDAASGILPSTSDSWFVHSSDTKVVSNATSSTACLYSYNATNGYATCGITVGDTGTTKIKVANFAFGTAAASLPATQIVSNELELRVVGTAASVAIAFDKKSYKPGEQATITLTAKDADGFVVPSQTVANLTTGIDYSSGTDVTETTVALTKGIKTYTVNVPTVGGDFVALVKGGTALPTAGQVTSGETVTVVDPAEDAANSALDAAQEATDAAIAATDAAILAQEAADEAAAAATAAQETAQAAVDAVTALSGQVTKLVAQLATLQKLINRIAKKVGVKR